jgi:hypothetical protein
VAAITTLPTAKKVGPSLRVSLALVIVGVIVAIPAAVKAATPILHTFATSTAFDTPTTIHRHLTSGDYELFQETGSGFNPGSTTLDPSQVTVTGRDGTRVTVGGAGGSEFITRGSREYTAAVAFTIDHAGNYDIAVTNQDSGRIILARSFGDVFREVGKWLLVFALGALLVVTGITLGIIGAVRRANRNRHAESMWPPSGWYADPSGAARLRYWDGTGWTEHFDR